MREYKPSRFIYLFMYQVSTCHWICDCEFSCGCGRCPTTIRNRHHHEFGQFSMRLAAGLLSTALGVALGLSTSTEAASPPVQVSLRSSWPAHNLVPEFLSVSVFIRHKLL